MISELCLKNFKCFEYVDLPLSKLNLLAGINSMGKSSVIQSLLLLRQSYEQGFLNDRIRLNGNYTNIGRGRDLLYRNAVDSGQGVCIRLVYNDFTFSWKIKYEADNDSLMIDEAEYPFPDTPGSKFNASLFRDSFEYISADRIGPRIRHDKTNASYSYIKGMKRRVGVNGEYAIHYLLENGEKDLVVNSSVLHTDQTSRKIKYQSQCWLSEISPGLKIRINEYKNVDTLGILYMMQGNETTEEYRPHNIGFGVSYVLPVIVALLKAKPGDLLIIENPEAHLHPSGQRKIGELMARASAGGVQIIVETHSDHILNGIRIAAKSRTISNNDVRLLFFSKNLETSKYEVHVPEIKQNGRLSHWPKGFFDEWDKAVDELF
jgi:predicted ATPase